MKLKKSDFFAKLQKIIDCSMIEVSVTDIFEEKINGVRFIEKGFKQKRT